MSSNIRKRLAELPLRAVVAFAARCARRVQPLGQRGEYQFDYGKAMARAIEVAEAFARGEDVSAARAAEAAKSVGYYYSTVAVDGSILGTARNAARATARAIDAVNDYAARDDAAAARNAAAAAARSAERVGENIARTRLHYEKYADVDADQVVAAANADLDRLLTLKLGEPRTGGSPIDPSVAGPLGPLWAPRTTTRPAT